ncbi:MAG TPA: hypothetical protein VF711_08590, partial [Acidimicrobiales bacterium]
MAWHAVDTHGRDPATGRPPRPPGSPTPAAALRRVPVATWPVRAVADDGRAIDVASALGPGGVRVGRILARLAAAARPPAGLGIDDLARATPGGDLDLPVTVASGDEAVASAAIVDPEWLALVDERRSQARAALRAAGREVQLEAALNLAMLLGTEAVDGSDDEIAARVGSGARLWLLGGA